MFVLYVCVCVCGSYCGYQKYRRRKIMGSPCSHIDTYIYISTISNNNNNLCTETKREKHIEFENIEILTEY